MSCARSTRQRVSEGGSAEGHGIQEEKELELEHLARAAGTGVAFVNGRRDLSDVHTYM